MTETVVHSKVSDRLSSTLFLAVLFHGVVILGVTFSADPPLQSDNLPTLKVTLLVDTQDIAREPDDFDYLAQRNQQGAGRSEDTGRAAAALRVWETFDDGGYEIRRFRARPVAVSLVSSGRVSANPAICTLPPSRLVELSKKSAIDAARAADKSQLDLNRSLKATGTLSVCPSTITLPGY